MNPRLPPIVLCLLFITCFVKAQDPQDTGKPGSVRGTARESGPPSPQHRSSSRSTTMSLPRMPRRSLVSSPFTASRTKLYFEIPQTGFDQPMLWQAEVAKGPPGVSWGGKTLGSSVLRWERRGKKVYLWKIAFAKRAAGKAVQIAVDSANNDTIVASFPVEAEGKDRSTVILVTPLFTTDFADLSVKGAAGSAAVVDESRSYLSDVKAFPTNIEVRSVLTFRSTDTGATTRLGARRPDERGRTQSNRPGSLQPGEAAGNAYDASLLRPARRLLHRILREVRRSQDLGDAPAVHRSLSTGEKGSQRQRFRAGQAHHFLSQPGSPREMAAVS